ncbi:MAG: hypothetical protein VW333_12560 [Pseudomonadales bacterium]
MNQPQRWRGSPSSPLGAVIFVGMLLALLLTTSGCVHVAMLGVMSNVSQAHHISKLHEHIKESESVRAARQALAQKSERR